MFILGGRSPKYKKYECCWVPNFTLCIFLLVVQIFRRVSVGCYFKQAPLPSLSDLVLLLGDMGGWAECVETLWKQGPPCCPWTRSPCQAANFMQPSSCLWNRERDRERYYLQDGAEIRGGNWVETLAMHKSQWYIIMGACFPASILFPHLLFFPRETILLLSVSAWLFYVQGGWEACKTLTHQLRWIYIYVYI